MGYRTIVVFNNEFVELLMQDQEIGRKIYQAILKGPEEPISNLGYVAEQEHTDVAKLLIVGNKGEFGFVELAGLHRSDLDPDSELTLLKQAVEKLGYELTKQPIQLETNNVDHT